MHVGCLHWFADVYQPFVESADDEVKRQSENLLNLLYNIGEDQAKSDCVVHRGISCNICNSNPLTGIRYKCSNCIDYDVCSRCEPVCDHEKNHVFLKIVVPIPPLANPRSALLPSFYPGMINSQGMDFLLLFLSKCKSSWVILTSYIAYQFLLSKHPNYAWFPFLYSLNKFTMILTFYYTYPKTTRKRHRDDLFCVISSSCFKLHFCKYTFFSIILNLFLCQFVHL